MSSSFFFFLLIKNGRIKKWLEHFPAFPFLHYQIFCPEKPSFRILCACTSLVRPSQTKSTIISDNYHLTANPSSTSNPYSPSPPHVPTTGHKGAGSQNLKTGKLFCWRSNPPSESCWSNPGVTHPMGYSGASGTKKCNPSRSNPSRSNPSRSNPSRSNPSDGLVPWSDPSRRVTLCLTPTDANSHSVSFSTSLYRHFCANWSLACLVKHHIAIVRPRSHPPFGKISPKPLLGNLRRLSTVQFVQTQVARLKVKRSNGCLGGKRERKKWAERCGSGQKTEW